MFNTLSNVAVLVAFAVLLNIDVAVANIECPQPAANDPNTKLCATNSYGSTIVTRTEFENWNCNHPLDKYEPFGVCVAPPTSCGASTCDQAGPTVCAHLANPHPHLPPTTTTAIFANQCQLNYYNCINPNLQYVAAPLATGLALVAPGLKLANRYC